MEKLKWGRPARSRKFHVFGEDGRSLCGSWMFTGADQAVHTADFAVHPKAGTEDCRQCYQKAAKLMGVA